MPALARLVHPHDANLAIEIATAMATMLEAIGIAPPSPPALSLPLPAPPPPPDAVVDGVVCAAAEAIRK
jgi:hypothetical protein